jgi:hypothetical protein
MNINYKFSAFNIEVRSKNCGFWEKIEFCIFEYALFSPSFRSLFSAYNLKSPLQNTMQKHELKKM